MMTFIKILRCYVVGCLILACGSCDTAGTITPPHDYYFMKYYGSDGNQSAVDLQVLDDGSFLILGNSVFDFSTDVILMRVDGVGKLLWQKSLVVGIGVDLEPVADGSFVVLVNVASGFQLLRITGDGDILDQSPVMSDGGNVIAHSVTPLADGGFMVSGQSQATGPGVSDPGNVLNFKVSSTFGRHVAWGPVNHGFGGGGSGSGESRLDVAIKTFQKLVTRIEGGQEIVDTLYYVFGYSNTNIGNDNPLGQQGLFYFERGELGQSGQVRYAANPDASNTEIRQVLAVPSTLGSGYVVLGTARRSQDENLFLARLRDPLLFNSSDATLFTNVSLGRQLSAVAVAPSLVGARGFFLLGNESRATGSRNIWLTKIDQSGAVQWSATFGSENENDTAAAVVELPDGRIVVLGTMALADNQTKIALFKINAQGQFLQ